jgi:transposase InsO family protein
MLLVSLVLVILPGLCGPVNEQSRNPIARLALLREEMRVKDVRIAQIDPKRRPRYPPNEHMAILELRATRGWSLDWYNQHRPHTTLGGRTPPVTRKAGVMHA